MPVLPIQRPRWSDIRRWMRWLRLALDHIREFFDEIGDGPDESKPVARIKPRGESPDEVA